MNFKNKKIRLPKSRAIKTGKLIEKLIKAEFHKATNRGKGMEENDYRSLWPTIVIRPAKYAVLFERMLLVDRTIAVADLIRLGNFSEKLLSLHETSIKDFEDILPAPGHPETRQPLTRYIAFIQLGENNFQRWQTSERYFKMGIDTDYGVGLTTIEGLFVPTQHEDCLRWTTIQMLGSRRLKNGLSLSPQIVELCGQPTLCEDHIYYKNLFYVGASRGAETTIPVT